MSRPENQAPKSPTAHLHAMNLVVALLAGVISITGGIYSLKTNVFAGPAYGSLRGIVRDEKIAKPLKLVSVEIADLTGAVLNTAATDDDGHYLIESLKTGNYVVKFTAPLHKVETKTIKIEKDLASSINVDLFPDAMPITMTPVESVTSVSQNIPQPSVSSAAYQTVVPAASSYNAVGSTSSAPTVPSTYSQSDSMSDSSFPNSQSSGFHQRPRRRPPGAYGTDSATSSQGDSLAAVGTQLLSALITKKSDN